MTIKPILVALLAAGLAGSAIAQGTMNHGGHSMAKDQDATHKVDATHKADMGTMIEDMRPSPKDTASTAAFKRADMAMMHDMHVAYTGNADVDFRTHMIPHHEGAIAMAKVALDHAKDAETRTLARQIMDDQEKEIAQMRAWLKKNGRY